MADDMCGPSNGLKGFVRKAERDRSLQQDRVTPASGQNGLNGSFRSTSTLVPRTDQAFESFQNSMPAPAHPMAGPTASRFPLGEMAPAQHMAGNINGRSAAVPGPLRGQAPGGMPHYTAQGQSRNMNDRDWVGEFNQMHLAGPAGPPLASSARGGARSHYPLHPDGYLDDPTMYRPFPDHLSATSGAAAYSGHGSYMGMQSTPSPQPLFAGPPLLDMNMLNGPYQSYRPPSSMTMATPVTQSMATAQHQPDNSDQAAFNAAFDEWTATASGANTAVADADAEFEREMAAWMAQHGPSTTTATTPGPQQQQPQQHHEALHETVHDNDSDLIDATLEHMADELDLARARGDPAVLPQAGPGAEARRARAERDALADAALDILRSVDGETSAKFRASSFLGLMRRIKDRQVVVEGDQLVEAATGEVIVTRGSGGDVGGGEGAAETTDHKGESERQGKATETDQVVDKGA